jgi:uncharacterized protein YjbI with pentapeptide repeats
MEEIKRRLPDEGRGRRRWPGGTSFDRAIFVNEVSFASAIFERPSFANAVFEGDVRFTEAIFNDDPSFFGTQFKASAWFNDACFHGTAYFSKGRFHAGAIFDGATFSNTVVFEETRFDDAQALGPFVALTEVILWGADFVQPVEIAIAAPHVDATWLRLEGGGTMRLRWAELEIANASFGAPTVVTGDEPLPVARFLGGRLVDERRLLEVLGVDADADARPRLLSVRHADAERLTFRAVDLRRCRFAGARNLDRLRLLAEAELARTPGPQRIGGLRPPRWMWTRRRVIADEYEWRLRDDPRREVWEGLLGGPVIERPEPRFAGLEARRHMRRAEPAELAALYRQLRKAQEEAKDEPGAADFYYGESEMKRHARETPAGERVVLTLYWLVSGYGLRASRALIALVVTVLVFALLFWQVGFEPQVGLTRALLFSLSSTTSLFRAPRAPGAELTELGELLQIVLRLLGPLFFGLALFALRGRVKR